MESNDLICITFPPSANPPQAELWGAFHTLNPFSQGTSLNHLWKIQVQLPQLLVTNVPNVETLSNCLWGITLQTRLCSRLIPEKCGRQFAPGYSTSWRVSRHGKHPGNGPTNLPNAPAHATPRPQSWRVSSRNLLWSAKSTFAEQHNERGYDLNAGNLKPGVAGNPLDPRASPRWPRLLLYGHIRAGPLPGPTHYDPTLLSILRDFTKTHHPQILMAYLIPCKLYSIMKLSCSV